MESISLNSGCEQLAPQRGLCRLRAMQLLQYGHFGNAYTLFLRLQINQSCLAIRSFNPSSSSSHTIRRGAMAPALTGEMHP